MLKKVRRLLHCNNGFSILIFMFVILTRFTTADEGHFVKPTNPNSIELQNKILQLHNNIAELNKLIKDGAVDVNGIKLRMGKLEKELDEIQKLNDDIGNNLRQEFEKINKHVADSTQSYQNITVHLTDRLHDLEQKLKLHRSIDEFYKALSVKNFHLAAINLNEIPSINITKDLASQSYDTIGNMKCFLKFTEKLSMDRQLLMYAPVIDLLMEKSETYENACRLAFLSFYLNKIQDDLELKKAAEKHMSTIRNYLGPTLKNIVTKNNHTRVMFIYVVPCKDRALGHIVDLFDWIELRNKSTHNLFCDGVDKRNPDAECNEYAVSFFKFSSA